jgi:ATP phosphoribosyltransferase regulatory subunit
VEIGQVAFFNGLVEQAGLSHEDIEKLRERIECKDSLGIKELTEKLHLTDEIKSLMIALPELFGDLSVIDKADVSGLNPISKAALDNIRSIYKLLESYGFSDVISIDLGMLQSIDYYTGSIFKCYTHGVGFPVCAGGRYNNLVGKFGKNMSAVGVAFGINRILSALRKIEDENEEIANSVVFAKSGCDADAYIFAKNLRVSGFCCEQYIDGYDEKEAEKYAEKVGAPYFFKVGEDDYLSVKNLISGDYVETTVEEFLENFE